MPGPQPASAGSPPGQEANQGEPAGDPVDLPLLQAEKAGSVAAKPFEGVGGREHGCAGGQGEGWPGRWKMVAERLRRPLGEYRHAGLISRNPRGSKGSSRQDLPGDDGRRQQASARQDVKRHAALELCKQGRAIELKDGGRQEEPCASRDH